MHIWKRCYLEGKGFTARSADESDVRALARNMSDDDILFRYLAPETNPVSERAMWSRIYSKSSPGNLSLVVVGGESAGLIEITRISPGKECRLGYWLGRSYWSQGIMTQAIGIVLPWLFRECQVCSVRARVLETNKASEKVLLNNGFVYDGFCGETVENPDRSFTPLYEYYLEQQAIMAEGRT